MQCLFEHTMVFLETPLAVALKFIWKVGVFFEICINAIASFINSPLSKINLECIRLQTFHKSSPSFPSCNDTSYKGWYFKLFVDFVWSNWIISNWKKCCHLLLQLKKKRFRKNENILRELPYCCHPAGSSNPLGELCPASIFHLL